MDMRRIEESSIIAWLVTYTSARRVKASMLMQTTLQLSHSEAMKRLLFPHLGLELPLNGKPVSGHSTRRSQYSCGKRTSSVLPINDSIAIWSIAADCIPTKPISGRVFDVIGSKNILLRHHDPQYEWGMQRLSDSSCVTSRARISGPVVHPLVDLLTFSFILSDRNVWVVTHSWCISLSHYVSRLEWEFEGSLGSCRLQEMIFNITDGLSTCYLDISSSL